jgi:glycosyltransferase involved in cell wall biosynthesis
MKVLLVHNRYQQRGGEDSVVESEREILADQGVEVELLHADNDHIQGVVGKLKASTAVVYSAQAVSRIKAAIAAFKPDVVHVHNWFPTMSPAIFSACNRSGVPVVHTLHNYRLLCVKASLYRDGKPCEDCIGRALRLPGIVHGCYRSSRMGSAAATAAMLVHWRMGTWSRAVDRFIALSDFAKVKLVEGGLPAAKIVVKPNSLAADPGVRLGEGGYFAYVGRLTDEKGIPTLLECWRRGRDLPKLCIVGTGPLQNEVAAAAAAMDNVEWVGSRGSNEVMDIIGNAKALICPSSWYEGMPRVTVESMAVGTPVIASRLGTYLEMIDHGRNGMLFDAGNANALLACVKEMPSCTNSAAMRQSARSQFELRYSAKAGFQTLMQIYGDAIVAWQKCAIKYNGCARAA